MDGETSTGTPAPADEGAPLAERVGKIETEQERQGGILDQIRDHLTGRADTGPAPAVRGDDPGPSAADMAEQMRQAVRDVRAEEAAAATKDTPARPEPETTPREVMIRGKDKLQRVLFGGDKK